jgi:hypothetical protein
MSSNTRSSEKASLLPRHEIDQPQTQPQCKNDSTRPSRSEFLAVIVLVILMAIFVTMLYLPYIVGPDSRISQTAIAVAIGLHTSTWTSLTAPILFFMATPWLVPEERIILARYLALVAYFVSTIVGAGMIGWGVKDTINASYFSIKG